MTFPVRSAAVLAATIICTGAAGYVTYARAAIQASNDADRASLARTRLPPVGSTLTAIPAETVGGSEVSLRFPAGGLLILFRAGEYWSGVNWSLLKEICANRPPKYCTYIDTSGQATSEFARSRGLEEESLFRKVGRLGLESINVEPATIKLEPGGRVRFAVAGELTPELLIDLGESAIQPVSDRKQ